MNENAIENSRETTGGIAALESAVIQGDLSKLSPTERVDYYRSVCNSLGLNPYTKPFDYIILNGKLTLYAKRDAADQLRRINRVSIDKTNIEYVDDLIIVTVQASTPDGRNDMDLGVVSLGQLKGEGKANAIMKALTKGKRRVTLSLCGLGWLDETEVQSIAEAVPVTVDTTTGEIIPDKPILPPRRGNALPSPTAEDAVLVPETAPNDPLATIDQLQTIKDYRLSERWKADPAAFAQFTMGAAGRKFAKPAELTLHEASLVIEALEAVDVADAQAITDSETDSDPFDGDLN